MNYYHDYAYRLTRRQEDLTSNMKQFSLQRRNMLICMAVMADSIRYILPKINEQNLFEFGWTQINSAFCDFSFYGGCSPLRLFLIWSLMRWNRFSFLLLFQKVHSSVLSVSLYHTSKSSRHILQEVVLLYDIVQLHLFLLLSFSFNNREHENCICPYHIQKLYHIHIVQAYIGKTACNNFCAIFFTSRIQLSILSVIQKCHHS